MAARPAYRSTGATKATVRLLVITANDIDQAGITFAQRLPTEWLDAELSESGARATAEGDVRARLSRSGKSDIVVRGDCHAEVELPCARCLKPTAISVDGELSLLLKARPTQHDRARVQDRPSSRGTAAPTLPKAAVAKAKGHGDARHTDSRHTAEYEFTSEEADLDEYDGDTVVLDAFVREALLLELPNFPLCSDACPGISRTPWRGEATTAEPVRVNPFEALKHLRPSLGSKPGEPGLTNGEAHELIYDGPQAQFPAEPTVPRASPLKIETKIASTHAAPLLRPSSRGPSPSRASGKGSTAKQKRLKKAEGDGSSSSSATPKAGSHKASSQRAARSMRRKRS